MKFEEGYTVGIDLGTSYSAIAQLDEYGDPIIVDNADGDPITPSVILLKDGGRVVVGPDAEQIALADASRVVIGIKRRMGDQNYSVPFEGRDLSPEFLSSLILRRLKQDGERYVSPIRNAVITVPYYFNEPRRQATRHAGRIAGLNVVDIINEPTAATLAYAWRQGKLGRPEPDAKPQTVLVYDLGGGTFDVTVVRFTPTEFRVIATDGDTMLGGLDWSQRLLDFLAEQCESRIGLDPRKDPATLKLLGLQAEALKRDLSGMDRTSLEVEFRGRTVPVEVTRREFESRTADLLHRTRDTTEFVLDQAGITASQLDEVILVGGSTTMPAVGKMLRELTGREPFRGLNPQAAVAQGAAIHAAILQVNHGAGHGLEAEALKRRLKSITVNDVNSHSLGVEITLPDGKKQNHIMIPRNSRLPVQVRQKFLTTHDNPAAIHVRLLEGEVRDISACTFIGDFRLIGLPGGLPKGSPVQITYGYSDRGHIVASLKDLTGGSEAQLEIAWNHAQDDQTLKTLELLAQSYNVQ